MSDLCNISVFQKRLSVKVFRSLSSFPFFNEVQHEKVDYSQFLGVVGVVFGFVFLSLPLLLILGRRRWGAGGMHEGA